MSFPITHEIDPDNASIRDVLLCWESEEEDDDVDSVQLIPKIGDLLDPIVNVIPVSPRVASPASVQGDSETFARLMMKYPKFVPRSIPKIPAKRNRPLCIFVNYMGIREPTKVNKVAPIPIKVNSKLDEPSSNPSDAPSPLSRPTKKPRMLPSAVPMTTSTAIPKCHDVLEVSPMPTLGPTLIRKPVSPTY